MSSWVYILIASVFEVCWIFSLKLLEMKKIATVKVTTLFSDYHAWQPILPLLGYIAFGLGNIYFFSLAMKDIPASTAFAVWMALALIFTKVVDVVIFDQTYNVQQIVFTILILIGIVGMKWFEQ